MKLEFIHHDGSSRLILIFAGWSTGKEFYETEYVDGWDVAVVSGDGHEEPCMTDLKNYHTIYLYAWSMGVYFAQRFLPEWVKPTACYAVCGTPTPCDDKEGIPRVIFEGTARNLDRRNLDKFRRRMCGSSILYNRICANFGEEDTDRLRMQLIDVMNTPVSRRLQWRAAYIGMSDRIFPPANQIAAWRDITEVICLEDTPHYIDLSRIVRHTIIDTGRVGERFTRSLGTYTQHAHAQRLIAGRLADLISEYVQAPHFRKVIEIGSGTGIFSHIWCRKIDAEHAVFMDLCDMPVYGVAREESYLKGDAEIKIETQSYSDPGSIDAILSASAVQWFSNPEAFYAHCHALLRQGGILALSTFSPGNLPELCSLRSDPMYYPSASELKSYMHMFNDVIIMEETVEIDFTTPMEALRHLRLTGVTGSGAVASTTGIRRFVERYPQNKRGRYSLTFKPLYILARKG